MRLTFAVPLLSLSLVSGVLAEPHVVERDIKTITGLISDIGDKVDSLHSTINNLGGGNPDAIVTASEELVKTINSATDTVKKQDKLSSTDALGLVTPIQDMTKQVEATVDALIDKKSAVVGIGYGAKTEEQLVAQKTAADGLSAAIVALVPDTLQSTAQGLASGIAKAIQKGVDAFKGAPGGTGDGGDGGDTATAPAPTATETPSETETSAPAPTGEEPTPEEPSDTGCTCAPAPTSSTPVIPPAPTSSGGVTPTPSSPGPIFTGAANVNKFRNSMGYVVALAAVVAF